MEQQGRREVIALFIQLFTVLIKCITRFNLLWCMCRNFGVFAKGEGFKVILVVFGDLERRMYIGKYANIIVRADAQLIFPCAQLWKNLLLMRIKNAILCGAYH